MPSRMATTPPDTDLGRIGANVKAFRIARAWTQEELAHALGESGKPTDRAYISRVESGQHNPSTTTLLRIARSLGVRPAELLDGIE